jgi:alpha,alpha-trehalose phosphorylase
VPGAADDPRSAAAVETPLAAEEAVAGDQGVVMVHCTRTSGLRVGAAMGHEIDSPDGTIDTEVSGDVGRVTVATRLEPGRRLRIVKYLAYGWSSQRSRPAVHDQVIAALAAAKLSGWDGLLREQREYLDDFWDGADVEVDGDPEVQQAVRFGLFHVLQAGARGERRPISAKGLTGPGYDGHTFWDTESFVLPVLTYTQPRAVADALRWRHSTLDHAKRRAEQLGLAGAAFPWRTIQGDECSGYWPAGTAAFHIGADIAHAVISYLAANEDEPFARDVGLELLVETARLWRSLGHHDAQGRFRIDGVTGPDEYSAIADDNVYTNLMAQENLQAAAALAERHPAQADRLGVTDEETASWRDAAADMYIPYDRRLHVHPQSEGFTDHAPWDFARTGPEQYPLMLNFPYFDIYRKQVVKQADLVLAMHLRGDAFTPEQKARNFAYYEALTVRDSSLSACTQAVMAAETGHLDLAHDYLGEAALMDLGDLEHNTRDGLHIASLAGAWTALVAGLGGMRVRGETLMFTPRLPGGITRLAFRMRFRGRRLKIHVTAREVVYELIGGDPLEIGHNGERLTLNGGKVARPVVIPPAGPPPTQPAGRAPRRRGE